MKGTNGMVVTVTGIALDGAPDSITFALHSFVRRSPPRREPGQDAGFAQPNIAERMRSFASHPPAHPRHLCGSAVLERGHLLLLRSSTPPAFCARLDPLVFATLFCWRRQRASSLSLPHPHPASAAPNANGHIDHLQVCLVPSTRPTPCRQALLLSLEHEGFRQVVGKSCSAMCSLQNL